MSTCMPSVESACPAPANGSCAFTGPTIVSAYTRQNCHARQRPGATFGVTASPSMANRLAFGASAGAHSS